MLVFTLWMPLLYDRLPLFWQCYMEMYAMLVMGNTVSVGSGGGGGSDDDQI